MPRLYKFLSLEIPIRIDYTDNYELCIMNYELTQNSDEKWNLILGKSL